MTQGKAFTAAVLSIALASFATVSFAQQEAGSARAGLGPWYLGASMGTTSTDFCNDLGGNCDDSDTGFKVYAGYWFDALLGAEVGYLDLGEYGTTSVDGFNLNGMAKIPISRKVNFLGKVGMLAWNSEVGGAGGGSDDGFDFNLGLGASYNFKGNIVGRVEWEWFNGVADSDISLLSAGIVYEFLQP